MKLTEMILWECNYVDWFVLETKTEVKSTIYMVQSPLKRMLIYHVMFNATDLFHLLMGNFLNRHYFQIILGSYHNYSELSPYWIIEAAF